MPFPKIIAHRGVPHIAPENTMASFRTAIDMGVDGIETDVQMTKDGQLVLIHDEKLDRTTNGKGLVKDLTLKEIKELSAGEWFDAKYRDEKVPTLEEFLQLVAGKDLLINIEIKSGIVLYPDIEKKLIAMLHQYNLGKNVIISSFNHYSLVTCKQIDGSIKTGILYMEGLVDPWDYAKRIGADALHPFFYTVRPETIVGMKQSGLIINPFTVDGYQEMKAMVSLGVNGIITNYSDRLIEMKKEMS